MNELDRHDLELRDVRDGRLVVSYNAVNRENETFTIGRHVSSRLPLECLVLFDGGSIDVSDLTDEERRWVASESASMSNPIDFEGVAV